MMANFYSFVDPIVAIATPLVPSALGIIRLSGKNTLSLLSNIFSRPQKLIEAQGHTLVYGWILDKNCQKKIDEVMIGVYHKPKSFTGEEMAEIFCHGGIAVVTGIFDLLLKNGFRQAHKGEFSCRGFVNGKTDLTKAEAIREVIEAKTDTSRNHAINRLQGNLFDEIMDVKKNIISAIAEIDVGIEYPEDEENITSHFNPQRILLVKKKLSDLKESWKTERLYQDGIKIVLLGKTNAGKSSLFNELLKDNRSIVSDIHGTTRDWLESSLSLDGIPVRLFDTAGIRKTTDVIEKEGVNRTLQLIDQADMLLYLFDINHVLDNEELDFIEALDKKNVPLVVVANKIDLLLEENSSFPFEVNKISVKNKIGLTELSQKIKSLFGITQNIDGNSSSGVGSERQKNAVTAALESIDHALSAMSQGFFLDAVIEDLEAALFALGEVTGETFSENILDAVFGEFCVGK
ncbi:MAG: tRNA uridine-5-carboxymethylaminomethyl(34) synthesis GTPase MnmE [Treponemataceae bacterium]